jgi:hypothetical protein
MCFREQSLSVGCDIDGVNHLDHPTLGLLIVVVISQDHLNIHTHIRMIFRMMIVKICRYWLVAEDWAGPLQFNGIQVYAIVF